MTPLSSARSQTSLELLLSYGWILVVVAVIGATVITITQGDTLGISCAHPEGFLIEQYSIDSNNIKLSLRSGYPYRINNVKVSAIDDKNQTSNYFIFDTWDVKETKYVPLSIPLEEGQFSAKINLEFDLKNLMHSPQGECRGFIGTTGSVTHWAVNNASEYTFNSDLVAVDQNGHLFHGFLIKNEDAPTEDNASLAAFPGIFGSPGQEFLIGGNPITLDLVELSLSKVTTNPSDVSLEIRSDSITGSVIATSTNTINSGDLPEDPTWTAFTFSPRPTLAANTFYYLRLKATGTTGFVSWAYKHQPPGTAYPDGIAYRFDTQALTSYDFGFRLFQWYDTSNPTLFSNNAISVNKPLTGFIETANKPSGTEIKYNLSNDNGATWLWYSGTSWLPATGSYAESNTADSVNTNIESFPLGAGQIKFKAFLHSDGTNTPELIFVSLDN
jgi:hypothetical protein